MEKYSQIHSTQMQQVEELKNSWRRSENWDNINRNMQSEPNQRGIGNKLPCKFHTQLHNVKNRNLWAEDTSAELFQSKSQLWNAEVWELEFYRINLKNRREYSIFCHFKVITEEASMAALQGSLPFSTSPQICSSGVLDQESKLVKQCRCFGSLH